jgi:hypothetical protein
MAYRAEFAESEHMAIVALYDPASGDILHWHYFAADDASELPSLEELEREAVEHATRHASEEVRTRIRAASSLHIAREDLKKQGPFRVDLRTRTLAEANPG